MTTPTSKETRQAQIARRQKESILWWTIHQLGSLKLAMVLLFTIALACAIATFAESSFSAKVAQAYIYKAPWFTAWLVVLCVNLFAVTLTRWPWEKKHLGFVITHYGIILLLIGALIGQKFGFEGNVVLNKGTPVGRIITSRTIMQIDSPADQATYITDIDIALKPPAPDRKKVFPIPGSKSKVVFTDFTENMVERTTLVPGDSSSVASPGVLLELKSQMMGGQQISVPLWLKEGAQLDTYDLFGLASIRLVDELPAFSPADILKTGEGIPFTEHQIVFANTPESNVIDNSTGRPSGYRLGYDLGEKPGTGSLILTMPEGQTRQWPVPRKLPAQISVGDGLKLVVRERWNDFALIDGKPANASKQWSNPAILVLIEGKIVPGPHASDTLPRPELILAFTKKDTLGYQVRRGKFITLSGELREGETITPGWADWAITAKAVYMQAIPENRKVILSEEQIKGLDQQTLTPALYAHIVDPKGESGTSQWIPSGEVIPLAQANGQTHRVGFGLEAKQLPFLIRLEDFDVPRRQGTDDPADWISTIRFDDMKSGDSSTQISKMNHPASYPDQWWRPIIGLTYKFSQAQWDPNNLNQTTLQVLYDPGWLFKWIGSLGICAGIFIMFYFKPYARERSPQIKDTADINPSPETFPNP